MRKQIIIGIILFLLPVVYGVSVGTGVGLDIEPTDVEPLIWFGDGRIVLDDGIRPGRTSDDGEELVERANNYAFEGEQISWEVLVNHMNGITQVSQVRVITTTLTDPAITTIETSCSLDTNLAPGADISEFNVRRGTEDVDLVPADEAGLWATYDCILTVEAPGTVAPFNMYGEFVITAEVEDLENEMNTADESESWFFNPIIALSIDGLLDFGTVTPGQLSYSDTLLLGNDADDGSGVTLDMFISGTHFSDSSSFGTLCPTSNLLRLENFRYFATNGAYSSASDERVAGDDDTDGNANGMCVVNLDADTDGADDVTGDIDANGDGACDFDTLGENYVHINLGDRITNAEEVICDTDTRDDVVAGDSCSYNDDPEYSDGNQLTPGSEMALTLRLDLPAPCVGDFDTGNFFFWGEAV